MNLSHFAEREDYPRNSLPWVSLVELRVPWVRGFVVTIDLCRTCLCFVDGALFKEESTCKSKSFCIAPAGGLPHVGLALTCATPFHEKGPQKVWFRCGLPEKLTNRKGSD